MTDKIKWVRSEYDPGWLAKIGDVFTLGAYPVHLKFGKPRRGSKWAASVTYWDEATRTASRFGRDVYGQHVDTAREAMRLAEDVYREANAS